MKKLIYSLSLISSFAFAQNVKVTSNYGSENRDIQDLINFENIFFDTFNFQSETLKGKSYVIALEEFKNGKLLKTSTLFDDDYFKIEKDKLTLKFAFKLADGKLKTQIFGNGFMSKKSYFKLSNNEDDYAVKNFFGSADELTLDINKKNYIFAIITPTIHEDGSGSYCEVAQSDTAPEKLGEKFKIPHYFLVTVKFN
ncbi:hypothetical protein LUD75_10345 [Epilithonimonas sp. JDS]|uniref:hypothetical protein n=1 Tax=Epilithonimonas sp. JDS TaxID=2902797 RepID=UPI001E43BB2F|nr:hypothetical protein [Epilithonimonas sp. JDS]MCD9855109.1 hypothetical protein [Epilithonimonas sp. JDS]